MSEQAVSPTADASAPAAPVPAPASPSAARRPPRRVLRAVARWVVAGAVCAGLGTGVAYGLSGMERTDLPGLSTRGDGRWDYPELSLPALPVGTPRPFNPENAGEIHHADLRALLLRAPAGATPDKELTGGWVSTERYLSEYAAGQRGDLTTLLDDFAVRHIAARGWTMPDGTVSRVYLLRFPSSGLAAGFKLGAVLGSGVGETVAAAPGAEPDRSWPEPPPGSEMFVSTDVYAEPEPYGPTQARHAYVAAGDTIGLIVHEKKGGTPAVPFHQTVVLQGQLLG
ncbi:hypothetical protein ACIBJC_35855 [Streptomyces sp. NPDC050509]|uniref:hypothetical protein n=1 Tax=Streptomyces sp. NPDC050509 TaxID=3365620 RepID=UPI00379FF9E5